MRVRNCRYTFILWGFALMSSFSSPNVDALRWSKKLFISIVVCLCNSSPDLHVLRPSSSLIHGFYPKHRDRRVFHSSDNKIVQREFHDYWCHIIPTLLCIHCKKIANCCNNKSAFAISKRRSCSTPSALGHQSQRKATTWRSLDVSSTKRAWKRSAAPLHWCWAYW